jgi:tetratricopeptide (TPR) repeat protein
VSIFSAYSLADRFLEAANKAVELAPESLLAHEGLLKFYIFAPGIAGGSIKKAKQRVELISEFDSNAGTFALGRIYEYNKEYEKAEKYYRKALEIEPGRLKYNVELAFLLRKMERNIEAGEIFGRINQLKISGPFEHIQVWKALYETGRAAAFSRKNLEQGQQAIEQYLQRNISHYTLTPNDWAEFRLATIYLNQGKTKQAKELMKRLLTEEPESDLKKQINKSLKQLKQKSKF